MKRIVAALLFALQTSLAWAGCNVGALPFQLQNNTPADATQVMANFNQITTGASSNCASAGANNDITSLGALSTPLSPGQGGTFYFLGSNSTGTNTIIVAGTTPAFSLVTGNRVAFFATGTNTAASTLQVGATTVKNLFRRTQFGIQSTQGGEVIANNSYTVVYDGAEFVIENELVYVGEIRDFAGGVAPPGWLFADGTNYLQTTFPQLFNVIGQTYGGTAGTFNVPDTRGRVLAGIDNFGSAIGAAGRLTNAATGCGVAFTIGVSCSNASQSHTQIVAELATHTPTFNDPGHTHTGGFIGTNNTGAGVNAPGGVNVNTGSSTTGITMNPIGSSQAMPIVNPNLGVLKIIRF
ncbi:MAG TPA: phage tail protein [Candidatus Acidoferrum sp.]